MAKESENKKTVLGVIEGALYTTLLAACIGFWGFLSGMSMGNRSALPEKDAVAYNLIKNKSKDPTWKRYGRNIVYQDFYDIDFNSLPHEKIKKPTDLIDWVYDFYCKDIKDEKLMDKLILEKAESLGHSYRDLMGLSAKDAIKLCADITASGLTYKEVDNDKNFLQRYGRNLPTEKYLEIGLGDCDKYEKVTRGAFRFIKKINSNLDNIYDFDEGFGGKTVRHAWNSFVLLRENDMILTHIDPTNYDTGGELEARRGYHLPKSDLEILARFYCEIGDYEHSYLLHKEALGESLSSSDKDRILEQLAYLAGAQLEDRNKMKFVRQEYAKLGPEGFCGDSILYYSYMLERHKKNMSEAEKYSSELLKKYPDSYWAKNIKD